MSDGRLHVVTVAGARPNFMKVAPLSWAFRRRPEVRHRIVHTGQHYDDNMSASFFRDLDIDPPEVNLAVGSGSHARQTADIMTGFEEVLLRDRPDLVIVVGDVNSTIACALTAVKMGIPVAHVEAGLRSFDRSMPEEVNRVLTDAISDVLFVTEPSGVVNLRREGVPDDRVHLVGNVMIDTLLRCRGLAERSAAADRLGLGGRRYGVVTLHRPANVDDPERLQRFMEAFGRVGRDCPLVFPVHPRTRTRLGGAGDVREGAVRLAEPMPYVEFLGLLAGASLILTDSGGIQEEAVVLGVPCLTLRENTERPLTVEVGANRLVGSDTERLVREALEILAGGWSRPAVPSSWDGRAAERIVDIIVRRYAAVPAGGPHP